MYHIKIVYKHLRSWIVVIFKDTNTVQHVPHNWYSPQNNTLNNENTERCWFPFLKSEADKTSVIFNSQQIYKMILKCFVPNNTDGCWYNVKHVAGPFGNNLILISLLKKK